MGDLFERHPLPWALHPDFPRPGMAGDEDGVIVDSNGIPVVWSSEWFLSERGALDAILVAVNGYYTKEPKTDG